MSDTREELLARVKARIDTLMEVKEDRRPISLDLLRDLAAFLSTPPPRPPTQKEITMTFRKELETIINRHSMENGANTPDFILADYLCGCLMAFDTAVNARERWYSREGGCGTFDDGKPSPAGLMSAESPATR